MNKNIIDTHIKKLSPEEAKKATRERNALLADISLDITLFFNGTKISTGTLSPGCMCCGKGAWLCIYMCHECNSSCFYCRGYHMKTEPFMPYSKGDQISLDNPEKASAYIKKFNCSGVSFTGGEPLLVIDKIIPYVQKIRNDFDNDIYIWMYTNGKLVTDEILSGLSKAGLDEIRFNITSTGYDTAPVELAKKYIKTVAIEIAAVPEDYDQVVDMLSQLDKIGTNFLNLHQIMYTESNSESLLKRGYTITDNYSVYESEIASLKIIRYAIKNKITTPVHYCSNYYRQSYQSYGFKSRFIDFIKETYESTTKNFYVRNLFTYGSKSYIKRLRETLKKVAADVSLFKYEAGDSGLYFHGSLLPRIKESLENLTISYFTHEIIRSSELSEIDNISPIKKQIYSETLKNKKLIELYSKVVAGTIDTAEINKYMMNTIDTLALFKKAACIFANIKQFEFKASKFPDINHMVI